jgi:hypothetical protein
MTPDRIFEIALALEQIDPINWIQRLREFIRETDPPRVDLNTEQETIVKVHRSSGKLSLRQ